MSNSHGFSWIGWAAVLVVGCSSAKPAASTSSDASGADVAAGDVGGADTKVLADAASDVGTQPKHANQTVFLIMMENHNWDMIAGNPSAPYINGTLLPLGAHTENYFNPPGLHPSEPNYLWLEAGTNFGVFDDQAPSQNHQATTAHLATQLKDAGISWKSYQEDIVGDVCPLTNVAKYNPKHNPFVFFDDSTGNLDPKDPYCIAHNRPMAELAADLADSSGGKIARYNFLTPNMCNIMHDPCLPNFDAVQQGDDWLKKYVPLIMDSAAFKAGGLLMVLWEESELGDFPVGLIAIGDSVHGGNYAVKTKYTHSAMLRTMQEIFDVSPLLGDAANSPNLSELFVNYP